MGTDRERHGYGIIHAHVHDGPMRPHVSDTLQADRLKAGGIKPGTWALKREANLHLHITHRLCARGGPEPRGPRRQPSIEPSARVCELRRVRSVGLLY
jgi:hypothetical protein